MSIGRRETSNLRRRRLLVYQNSRDETAGTAADRRQFEKLREARCPSEVYGTSVNRRLRGRWFSLVPVRRRAMTGVAIVILGVAALLCLGHWAAVAWQPLAYRAELARPLRLDRPDSFGAWVRAAFFAAAAGTSVLVYQLRRYRNDDFRGSYRIWPPLILLMCVASLDAVCQLVPWGGELIEWLLGRRVALAGSDWIRIALTVGGMAIAMRMIAEVRHSKLAVVMMSLAILGFAIPMAARWGMLASDTPVRWLIITSSPMMASAALWVACGAYLRKLFREVRKMDAEDALSLRIEQWRERITAMRQISKREKQQAAEAAKSAKAARKLTKTQSKKRDQADEDSVTARKISPRTAAVTGVTAVKSENQNQNKGRSNAASNEAKKSRFKLRFWRRDSQTETVTSDTQNDGRGGLATQVVTQSAEYSVPVAVKADAVSPAAPRTSGAAGQSAVAASATGGQSGDASSATSGEAATKKKGRLFGWFGKKQDADGDGELPAKRKPAKQIEATKASGEDDDLGDGDDPSIDWATMGKAERRRLRREMKRNGQAA